jgi:hypothetical protein
MDDPSLDLDLAAATLQADNQDVRILLKVLVGQLGPALGDRISVERAGGLFKKSDEIKSVTISMGNDVFKAVVQGHGVGCTIGHSSGGIQIRSEQTGMDQWIKRLLGAVQQEAAHSQTARLALEQIVIGGGA